MAFIGLMHPIHMDVLNRAITEMLDNGSVDDIITNTMTESSDLDDEMSLLSFSSALKDALGTLRDFMRDHDDLGALKFMQSSVHTAHESGTPTDTTKGTLGAVSIFSSIAQKIARGEI